MTAQGYYTGEGQTPPAYLQTLRDDLDAYRMGYGAMSELAAYCYDGNRFAFDAEVPVVMGLVNQMSRAYRTEARYSIAQTWVDRATVQGYYSSQRAILQSCLSPPAPG